MVLLVFCLFDDNVIACIIPPAFCATFETKIEDTDKTFGVEYFPLDDTLIYIYNSNLQQLIIIQK